MSRGSLVLALTLLVVAGCGSESAEPGLGVERPFPRRMGPAREVAQGIDGGYRWRLVAQDSEIGLCLEMGMVERHGKVDLGCGFDVPEKHMVRFFAHTGMVAGAVHRFLAGPVAREVAIVRVELQGTDPVDVEPFGLDAGFDVRFFVSPVPGNAELLSVVALDPGGREIDSQNVPADPFGA
jgi:hypothetical protein